MCGVKNTSKCIVAIKQSFLSCMHMPVCAAGYAAPTDELLTSLKVTRYQSSKAALSFSEYSSGCSRLGVADVQQLLQSSGSSSSGGGSKSGRLRLAFAPN